MSRTSLITMYPSIQRITCTGSDEQVAPSEEDTAATILAPDEGKLVAIEKFIDQQIPQRRLEGFNFLYEPRIREAGAKPSRSPQFIDQSIWASPLVRILDSNRLMVFEPILEAPFG